MKNIDAKDGIISVLNGVHVVKEPGTVDIVQKVYLDLIDSTKTCEEVVYSTCLRHDVNLNERTCSDKFNLYVYRHSNGHSAAVLRSKILDGKERDIAIAWGPIIRLYNLIGDALKTEGLLDGMVNQ